MSAIALVTGGNRGIGSAIAKSLTAAGYTVIVTYRSGAAPTEYKSVRMDVTSTESVDAGFDLIEQTWGSPEIVVCNAGVTKDTLSMRMSDEDFENVIDANLIGAFRTARRATKGLLKLKRGRLIFIGSVVGLSGSAGQVNYSASKAGLVGMARSFARELGSRGITANVVAPGFVETDMTATLDEKRRDEIAKSVPLQRFCSAEEIADVVTFLASPQASYITGAVIPVNTFAVIRWESARVNEQILEGEVVADQDIRPAAHECTTGDTLVNAGTVLTPAMIGLLAAAGLDTVQVVRKPKVALVLLGDEIQLTGIPSEGLVRDALGPQLPGWLEKLGCEIVSTHYISDELDLVVQALDNATGELLFRPEVVEDQLTVAA